MGWSVEHSVPSPVVEIKLGVMAGWLDYEEVSGSVITAGALRETVSWSWENELAWNEGRFPRLSPEPLDTHCRPASCFLSAQDYLEDLTDC